MIIFIIWLELFYKRIIEPYKNLMKKERKPMASKDVKIYKFSRGEKYQCQVRIVEGSIIFEHVIYPVNAAPEVISKLLDDAEREALKLHSKVR